jgi:spermidine synthase
MVSMSLLSISGKGRRIFMDAEKRFQKMTKVLFRTRGLVHDVFVTRRGRTLTLWSSAGVRHTVFDSAAPHVPGLEYARNMLAALAFCPQAQSCLVLGLGGGSISRMLLAARPQIEVEAVEIDPAVVELATKYFNIRTLPRFTVHVEDATDFLRHCTSQYDIVVVDAYVEERFPDRFATPEFIKNARECMPDDGVLAVNWLGGDPPLREGLLKNLRSIVGPVWQLPGLKSRNLLYFAPAATTSRPEMISAAESIEAELPFENSLARLVQRIQHPR